MSQINTKFIKDNAVNDLKIRLANNSPLRARNAADSGDVNILKVDASNIIQFSSLPQVSSDPSASNDLVRKSYIDNLLNGLRWKEPVRAATTADITLSGAQTIDGVAVIAGNRVLVKNQATASENGIYVASASAWSRAADSDSGSELVNASVFVSEGTANGDKGFVCTNDSPIVVDTTSLVFTQFTAAGSYTAGNGISLSGGVFSVNHDGDGLAFNGVQLSLELDGSTLAKSATGLKVAANGISSTELASNAVTTAKITDANVTLAKLASGSVDENKIVSTSFSATGAITGGSASKIAVQVDASTIEIATNALQVKDAGITAAKLASNSVETLKIADANVTLAKLASLSVDENKLTASVAGAGLAGGAGTALSVNVDASTIEINVDTLRVKDAGITAAKLATDSVETLKIKDANVTAAKLATDSVETLKIKDANVTLAKLASLSVDENKLTASVAGAGLNGGAGSALSIDVVRESLTLIAGDITAQYIDMASKVMPDSVELFVDGGPIQRYGVDYSIDNSGAVSRILFDSTSVPSSDLSSGAPAALVATDVIRVRAIKL